MKKKMLTVVLLLSLLLCTACSSPAADDEESPNPTPSPTEPAPELIEEPEAPPYYDTKGADYGGASFGIWNFDNETATGWSGIPFDIFVEGLNGDVLNDAVYERNLEVEKKLNITIVGTNVAADFTTDLQTMTAAGDRGVDLIFPLQAHIPSLINKNVVYPVQDVEAFDFTEPWWNRDCNDTLTVRGKLFTVASDASFFDKLSTVVVFYNQELVTNYGIGNMYAMVEEGEWTFDRALELGEKVTMDLDGNGVYDRNDSIGISCQNDAAYYFLHGFGATICAPDEEGNMCLMLGSERNVGILQSIYQLMGDSMRFFNRQTYNLTLDEAIGMFRENRALFMIRPLQSLFVMREMEADFGIIPLPKYDRNQEKYYSAVNPYAGTICMIPMTAEDVERSGVVLSTMACESHYSVIQSLYETVLGEKLIRDQDSAAMLDYAFGGIVIDPGLIWDFGGLRNIILNHKGTDVASLLAKTSKPANKAIEEFNTMLEETE